MSRESVERERLLSNVKRAVKQLTEEAVTRRFVHEESSVVIALCVEIESALQFGLRRKFFWPPTTLDLLVGRLGALYPPANDLYRLCGDIVAAAATNSSSIAKSSSAASTPTSPLVVRRERTVAERLDGVRDRYSTGSRLKALASPTTIRLLWIRLALVENFLGDLLRAVVKNSSVFYEDNTSLVSHPVDGVLFVDLLDGPCSLEFSRMKTTDHLWTDPSADELLQRQRMSSSRLCSTSTEVGGALELIPELQTVACSESHRLAKDYVESLHQASGSTLLFAKNNVIMKPLSSKESVPGYLSLLLSDGHLTLKWMPNIPTTNGDHCNDENSNGHRWDLALSLDVKEIASLHCHLQKNKLEQLHIIGHDGRQFHPMAFPTGTLTMFLTCLESGLLPLGRLDPPLWARQQNGRDSIFPTRRKNRHRLRPVDHVVTERPRPRILKKSSNSCVFHVFHGEELKIEARPKERGEEEGIVGGRTNSRRAGSVDVVMDEASNETKSLGDESNGKASSLSTRTSTSTNSDNSHGVALQSTCDQMSGRIMSRAFYGWLGHVRYLTFIKKHLSSLVHGNSRIMVVDDPTDASEGLTREIWDSIIARGDVYNADEMARRVFYGGIQHELRSTAWPYLLSYYSFRSRPTERALQDADHRTLYEEKLRVWSTLERILKKKEAHRKAKRRAERAEDDVDDDSVDFNDPSSDSEQPSPIMDRERLSNGTTDGDVSLCSGLLNGDSDDSVDGERRENGVADVERRPRANLPLELTAKEVEILEQYDKDMLEGLALNLHRIDKDVIRCDRNLEYFTIPENLTKLKNILGTYIWQHRLTGGYVQGMCDILAPLVVILDDEYLSYGCFVKLMERLDGNFGSGKAIDANFRNLRALLKVMDFELYELLREKEVTHFYFAHRWFLVDFKREFDYSQDGVFLVWETLWAAQRVCSSQFQLFLALALLENYREIILDREMGFSELIKFFNEMSEQHSARKVLQKARQLVLNLHSILQSK